MRKLIGLFCIVSAIWAAADAAQKTAWDHHPVHLAKAL